ncbi:MAG: 5-formyltetrahydrofolate cyclo-ligase [Proteobacteria bacterium]|nr:5-formyltetrahydrofolate cyclo-ligase [Pseudomonadota bacterium]
MMTDLHGIPTSGAGDWLTPEVLLLPLNAFDAAGYRLGYGGGYFDRTLAKLAPQPLCIGIGFEINRVDNIRPQAHDHKMDCIVTENGFLALAGTVDQ